MYRIYDTKHAKYQCRIAPTHFQLYNNGELNYKKNTRWEARNEERRFALSCLVSIGNVWTGLLSVNKCDSKKQKSLHTMLLLLTNTLLHRVGRQLTIILAYLQLSSNPRNLLRSTVCSMLSCPLYTPVGFYVDEKYGTSTSYCDKRIINQLD